MTDETRIETTDPRTDPPEAILAAPATPPRGRASAGERRLGLPARDEAASGRGEAGIDDRETLELARRIVELASDKKAADIVLLGVGALTTVADYFVVCSGGSERQLGAIADGVVEALRDEGVRPIGREGSPSAHWVLIDFGAVIVHVFAPPERDYYALERLWSEAQTLLRVQ